MNTLNLVLLILLLLIMSGALVWPLIYISKQFRLQGKSQNNTGDTGYKSDVLERIVIVGSMNLLLVLSFVYIGYENKVFLTSVSTVFLVFIFISVLFTFLNLMGKEGAK